MKKMRHYYYLPAVPVATPLLMAAAAAAQLRPHFCCCCAVDVKIVVPMRSALSGSKLLLFLHLIFCKIISKT